MASARRLGIMAGLVAAVALGMSGCNLLQLPFFFFGPEPHKDAELKRLASEDKDKEVTVVILVDGGLETRAEFVGSERELTARLAKQLKESCQYNKEKVNVITPSKLEKFKQDHPNWHTMDKAEIGKFFKADYVIHLEVNSLTLYKKSSGNTLFQGKAEISVNLINVNEPEDGLEKTEFICLYPSETKGGVDVNDTNPLQFRNNFLEIVAKRLAWHFTAHPTEQDHVCE